VTQLQVPSDAMASFSDAIIRFFCFFQAQVQVFCAAIAIFPDAIARFCDAIASFCDAIIKVFFRRK
jgi:hypothetical protein